jgi:GH25 family lysozyme M1 (1,4-beta-N-acetylmuramidase)
MSEFPLGVDISAYQYSSDGKRKTNFDIINAKCEFVAVRAGISWGYQDKWIRYSWDNLTVPRMAYHVIYPGESAVNQMQHFLNIVRPTATDRLVLDMELDHGQTKAKITDTLIKCLEYVREHTGRYPIVYSRASWINQFVDVSQLPDVDWWLAHYLKALPYPQFTPEKSPPPALPNGVGRWLIHQTGERGDGSAVGVASHYVDTNRWNGTHEQMLAYFGLADDSEPLPPELPEVQEPLFEAKVVTVYPHRLRTRYTPELGNNVRPEADWHQSGQVVSVYETKPDWYRTAVETWASAEWLRRLDYEEPPVLIDIPPLWQQDPRWKDILLGYSKTMTIGGWGCLIVTLAMRLGLMPDVVNERQKAVGGFTGANVYWQMVQVAFPQLTDFQYIECYWTPAPLDRIDSRLAEGVPVHVHVDLYNETASMEQHWVLIIGKNGDDYVMNDPWTGRQGSFREAYGDPARWIFRIASWRKL